MDNNLANQNNTLPKNIEDILYSEYQHVLLYKIHRLYKLIDSDVPVIEEAVRSIYYGELNLTDLNKFLAERIKTLNIDVNVLARDIVGMRFLIAADYFNEHGQDIKKYLEFNGGISEKYLKNVETFKKALTEEANGTYDHNVYLYDDEKPKPKIVLDNDDNEEDDDKISDANLSDEARILRLKTFFETGLEAVLDLKDGEGNYLLEDINDELIMFLGEKPDLSKSLSSILFASTVLIGQENIVIDEKNLPPTGANWIKDFYRTVGSENFDSLAIAKYIITSPNAKKLAGSVQAKLRKFLNLYHNIKYFPAPFTAIPIERWEIMPGAHHGSSDAPVSTTKPSLENKFRPNPAPAPVYTKPVEKITTITPTIKKATPVVKQEIKPVVKTTPISTPISASTPTISSDDDEDLIELKNMLLQYPAGSLERAAIEEEIKTLQKNK